MKLFNGNEKDKVDEIYLFLGDRKEWCADVNERKWLSGINMPYDEYKTLKFGEFISVDDKFKGFINELSGNSDETFGAESYFLRRNIKNIMKNYYLPEMKIIKMNYFIRGYELAKKYFL